jgi:hypothetical protein
VRLFLTALMAVTLAIVTTTDRVACFDGCTDEAQHESPTTPSVCGLCHGWSNPDTAALGAPLPMPVAGVVIVASSEHPAHLARIDHPPRIG